MSPVGGGRADVTGDDAAVHLDGPRSSYVVWIVGDGLVRRAEVAFSDLGQPVTIEVPSAGEVVSTADLLAGMAGGGEVADFGELFGELGAAMTESTGP